MNKQNYVGIALEEFYRIFEELNKKFYKNQLSYSMITIQASKNSNILGWFTLDKMWISQKEKENEKYEINISAGTLNRSVEDIVETLLHEMVHYYNKLAEIVDYHGSIHTKKFKIAAEAVGLVCHKDSKVGWGLTERSENLTKFIQEEIKPIGDCFEYFRTFKLKKEVAERKKILFKFKCENCEVEAKAKKDTKLVCGECKSEMIMEDED